MNLDLKNAGSEYKTDLGDFSPARGELRLLNVTAGIGGASPDQVHRDPVTDIAIFYRDIPIFAVPTLVSRFRRIT